MCAFLHFCSAKRRQLEQENPSLGVGAVARQLSTEWRLMSPEQRKPYDEVAEREKQRYEQQKQAYEAGYLAGYCAGFLQKDGSPPIQDQGINGLLASGSGGRADDSASTLGSTWGINRFSALELERESRLISGSGPSERIMSTLSRELSGVPGLVKVGTSGASVRKTESVPETNRGHPSGSRPLSAVGSGRTTNGVCTSPYGQQTGNAMETNGTRSGGHHSAVGSGTRTSGACIVGRSNDIPTSGTLGSGMRVATVGSGMATSRVTSGMAMGTVRSGMETSKVTDARSGMETSRVAVVGSGMETSRVAAARAASRLSAIGSGMGRLDTVASGMQTSGGSGEQTSPSVSGLSVGPVGDSVFTALESGDETAEASSLALGEHTSAFNLMGGMSVLESVGESSVLSALESAGQASLDSEGGSSMRPLALLSPVKIAKLKKRKSNPYLPRRSMSAFLFYSLEQRPKVKAQNPTFGAGKLAQCLAEHWKGLEPAQRKPYELMTSKDKERYKDEVKAYKCGQYSGTGVTPREVAQSVTGRTIPPSANPPANKKVKSGAIVIN